jgi:hypothetical protein
MEYLAVGGLAIIVLGAIIYGLYLNRTSWPGDED